MCLHKYPSEYPFSRRPKIGGPSLDNVMLTLIRYLAAANKFLRTSSKKYERTVIHMKSKYKIIIGLLAIAAITYTSTILTQPETASAKLTDEKTVLHLATNLNKEETDYVNNKYFDNQTTEKFGHEYNTLDPKATKIELTFNFEAKNPEMYQRIADVQGAIIIGQKSFGFKGHGRFEPYVTPDTNETFYVGDVTGELKGVTMHPDEPNYHEFDGENTDWLVVFNPDNGKIHVAASVGFQDHTGLLFFGEKMMTKEYYDAFEKQHVERYGGEISTEEVGK